MLVVEAVRFKNKKNQTRVKEKLSSERHVGRGSRSVGLLSLKTGLSPHGGDQRNKHVAAQVDPPPLSY